MKKYIFNSTIFGIFTEAFLLRVGFDFKLLYIIIFVNLILLYKIKHNFRVPKVMISIIIYLLLSGICTIFIFQNKLSSVCFQVFGIAYMSFYFYNFFTLFPFHEIFNKYCDFSFYITVIGFPIYFIMIFIEEGYRFHSILTEPAHFCGIILPAFFYYLINFKTFRIRFFIILFGLLLSLSTIGFIFMLIGVFFSIRKINPLRTLIISTFIAILAYSAYIFLDGVKLRIDDSLGLTSEFKVSKVNASTLALATNLYTSYNAFLSDPLIGRGIGSHEISYKRYAIEIEGIDSYNDDDSLFYLNSSDAASLLLRIMSELGIVGLIGILFFLIKNYSNNKTGSIISKGVLLYFLYKLFREGHYFPCEFYFFVFLYHFNKFNIPFNTPKTLC
jgi:hypothetical protein